MGIGSIFPLIIRNVYGREEGKMTDLEAIMIIEADEDATYEQELEAWQHLIDTGTVWHLQGSYQRGAIALIQGGLCTDGRKS